MSQIDRIVQVYISRQTAQVDIASFSIPLILAEINTTTIDFPERVRTYTSAADVASDLGDSHPATIMARRLMGGSVRPAEFRVGKVEVSDDPGSTPESYADGLQAVMEIDDSWYALLAASHQQSTIMSLAQIIQASKKIYGTSTQEAAAVDALAVTDTGTLLEQSGYDRTFIMYSATADNDFPEAAWIGSELVKVPGSNTWEYKQLPGVARSNLTSTQINTLETKGYNYYIEVKGANITRKGTMASGEWIDTIIFTDWLTARIQEQIFYRMINTDKIPYTRRGTSIIEGEIRSVLSQGVTNGGIAEDTPIVVRSPDPLNIPESIRATRVLGDFTFEVRLAGAISVVVVRGTVSY